MSIKDDELFDLLSRCGLRDQAALKKLYERVAGYLNAVAFRIVKNDAWSNDVLQEAFIQIWENASTYRPDVAKPMTWMTSIVRYRALDRLAKEQRYHHPLLPEVDDGSVLDDIAGDDSPEQAIEAFQHDASLQTCLNGLSEAMGKSVRMAYLEGYSREEIAESLNANVNTVKSWLRRGAERLKRCIESQWVTE